MDNEALQNIWNLLTSEGLTDSSFEDWIVNMSEDDAVQQNVYNYLSDKNLTDSDLDTWLTNTGLKKKEETEIVTESVSDPGGSESQSIQTSTTPTTPVATAPSGEKNTYLENIFGKNEFTDFFGDLWRSGVQGFNQGTTVDEALEIFAKGKSATDQDLQDYIRVVGEMDAVPMTDEMKDFSKIYEKEGKGLMGFLKGIYNNPSVMSQVFTSSLAAMANPDSIMAGVAGAVALGAPTGGVGAIPGFALGLSGSLETALSFTEFLKEELGDKAFNTENIRDVLEDPGAISRIRRRSASRGVVVGGIDALTLGVASKVGVSAAKLTGKIGGLTAAGLTEGTGGAVGESLARAIAGQEQDVADIAFEGTVGGLTTLPYTAAKTLKEIKPFYAVPKYKIGNINVTRKKFIEQLDKSTPQQIIQTDMTVVNDEAVSQIREAKFQRATSEVNTLKAYPDMTTEDLNKVVDLSLEKTQLENNPSEAAKAKLSIINKDINNITDKYAVSKSSPEEIPLQKQPPTSATVREGDPTRSEPTREGEAQEGQTTPGEEVQDETQVPPSEVEEVLDQEVLIEEDTDSKGRAIKRFATTTEKDGVKTTTFTFNRGDKNTSQRNTASVKAEIAFGETLEIDPEVQSNQDNLKGVEVQKVTEIRQGDGGVVADIKVKDQTSGEIITLESIRLRRKSPTIQSDAKSTTPKPLQVGRNRVVIEEGVVKEILNPEGKPVKRGVRAKVEAKLIDDALIDVDKGTKAPSDPTITQINADQYIVDKSSNPKEIAEVIDRIKSIEKPNLKEALEQDMNEGLGAIFGAQFSEKSILELFGYKNIAEANRNQGRGFSRTWIDKSPGYTVSIEDSNNVLSLLEEQGVTGVNYDNVLEFIRQYPTEKSYKDAFVKDFQTPNNDLSDAEIKFEELTGLKPTPTNIRKVLASKEGAAQQRAEQGIFESERLQEEKGVRKKIETEVEKRTPKKEEPKGDIKFSKEFREERSKKTEESMKEVVPKFDTINEKSVRLSLFNFYSKIKAAIAPSKDNRNFRSPILEDIRSTPESYIDQTFGLKNSRVIYNTFIRPLVEAFSSTKNNLEKFIEEVDKNKSLLTTKGKAKDVNEIKKQSYQIGLYLAALEHESGNSVETSPAPLDLLNATIRAIDNGDILNKYDSQALKELRDKFTKEGEIKSQDVFEAMNEGQKEATKRLQKLNESLYDLAKTAADRRGIPFGKVENYHHRQVLTDPRQTEIDVVARADKFSDPSTMGATLIQRTPGAKAIQFDPFNASKRGAQETYLDYYMTPEAIGVQDLIKAVEKKYRKGNKTQREAAKALSLSIREQLKTTYLRSYSESGNNLTGKVLREAERIAYRSLLGSGPRFLAEVIGNAAMITTQDTKVIADAYGKYLPVWSKVGVKENTEFIEILRILNSAEVSKLAGTRGQSFIDAGGVTKYVDKNNVLNLTEDNKGMLDPVQLNMQYLSSLGPKQFYNSVAKIQDFLMGGADRVVARPMWVSKFANKFTEFVKKYNNETIDFTAKDFKDIGKNKSKYLDPKYKRAIRDAVREADQTSVQIVTSGNPMNSILKNISRPGTGLMNLYRKLNSFMANFTLNEYANARFAIGALQQEGAITKREAGVTLAALLARMSSYVILYRLFADFMDSLLGAPEDEEEDLGLAMARQLTGSAATLMFRQNLGNIPSLPVNLLIEFTNKNYLESLRGGAPYNTYENSIVYSLIDLDQVGKKSLAETAMPLLGPAYPFLRTADRTMELISRTQTRKTQAARDRAYDELFNRMSLEVGGQLGFIPFYKDARRIALKKRFRGKKTKPITKAQLRKLNPTLYKKLYGPDSAEGRLKKKLRDLKK